MAVRDRIRAVIEERGLKQAAVAVRLDEPEYWLSNRLTGRTVIKADELPKIAEALDVHPCVLLDLPETESPGGDRMAVGYTRWLQGAGATEREMRQFFALMRFMNTWQDEDG